MNKDEVIKKVEKSARTIKWIYRVLIVVLSVSIVMAMGALLEAFSILKETDYSFSRFISEFWLYLESDYERMSFFNKLLYLHLPNSLFRAQYIVLAAVEIVVSFITVSRVYRLFSRLAESGRPFDLENLKDIRMIVGLNIGLAIVENPIGGSIRSFVLWCLMKIYEYGCLLQQESDEVI